MNIAINLDKSGQHAVFVTGETTEGHRIGFIKDKPEIWTGPGTPDTSRKYFQRGYLLSAAEKLARRYAKKQGIEESVWNFNFWYNSEEAQNIYLKK